MLVIFGSAGLMSCMKNITASRAALSFETPEDTPPDLAKLDRLLADDKAISHVFAVHCETTSGILNPIGEIGRICPANVESIERFLSPPYRWPHANPVWEQHLGTIPTTDFQRRQRMILGHRLSLRRSINVNGAG